MKKLIVLSFACIAGSSSFAADWLEVGEATDMTPGQMTVGVGSLDGIGGSILGSDADVYCIKVMDWARFSATTVGGTTADTQLFLFTAGGMGIAFNDDSTGLQSTLPVANALYAGRTNGETVMIGISRWDKDPLSAGGEIFPDTFSGVHGPTGPGGGSALTGWDPTGGGTSTASYRIALTGATYCVPEPGTIAALGLGALVLLRRRKSK